MNSRPYSSWATAPPRPQTRIWFRNKVSWIQRILLPNSQVPGITGIYSNCPNISFQVDFKIIYCQPRLHIMIFFVKFCSRDCNMSSTISTNSVVFRAYKAFLCPFDAIHSFSDSLMRDESPEQAWLVQGCHVLPHSCLVLSQKEDRASGISRCQWPALADFNRFLVTLWRQVCSRQEQCTFWGWLPGSEEAPSQLTLSTYMKQQPSPT